MAKCSACGKFLSPTGAATCSLCPLIFHRGCVAIPETAIVSKSWACPECKKKVRRGDNTITPVKGICGNESPHETVSLPVAGFSTSDVSHPEEDENELRAMRREMAEYMGELRREMVELRTSIAGFGQRLDSIECRLDVLEQNKNTIAQLKVEINERDQEALLSDLDIGCLPEEKGENVYHIVTILAAKLGVNIEERDIIFAERIGGISTNGAVSGGGTVERSRRVVVRFARRNLRDELLHAARVRRNLTASDLGLASPSALSRRIYINERLTRINRYLFYKVREECRKRNWRYSWTKRGRIFARQGDGKQVFAIRSENDLARVFEVEKV
ncbi:hypothetical protein K1T71_008709 [Dendrolimus kikuchii]|uniref:Uncharacterized protein n=2 Tax=Dendrolimus kikuchii TaxID=765133 RepID=A0ACC1CVQ4_9NEOP|nr:hypothetical protein K1T71_013198 [Dendrolimus kikuchii]KAJ0175550.1 hypothetical protein K1T71_008709 [Dendrolimus kikuchii]